MRYIGLMDCNNFFVSCERLFRPDLVGKPVVVLSSNDGCIVARSQEAKDLGLPMGIPLFRAKQLVSMDKVTCFSSNFPLYRDMSRRVMEVLAREVGEIEIYSIDEAFFTISGSITVHEIENLRARIMKEVGIPVSIGVALTKTRAKVASKLAKKSKGAELIDEVRWRAVAPTYPIVSVWNVGGATARHLRAINCATISDFLGIDQSWIKSTMGLHGKRIYDELSGMMVHKVQPNNKTLHQSIASTRSFSIATNNQSMLEAAISYHVTQVAKKLREQKAAATVLMIELKPSRHSSFSNYGGTVAKILERPIFDTVSLLKVASELLKEIYSSSVPYKKAGVMVGGLVPETYIQASLFSDSASSKSWGTIDEVADSLNKRFGSATIVAGSTLLPRPLPSAQNCSPHYTTKWQDIPRVKTK